MRSFLLIITITFFSPPPQTFEQLGEPAEAGVVLLRGVQRVRDRDVQELGQEQEALEKRR